MADRITLDQLAKLVDSFEASARANFAQDGEIRPVTLLGATRKPNGARERGLAAIPWDGTRCGKDELRDLQQSAIENLEADWICNIPECWAVFETDCSVDIDYPTMVKPSEHPERRELIQIRAECRDGVISRTLIIERDAGGKGMLSPAIEQRLGAADAAVDAVGSRFAGYFTPPPVEA